MRCLDSESVITIMYIYHALINALSAHMIHINLNMIFYTHLQHRPTKTIYINYCTYLYFIGTSEDVPVVEFMYLVFVRMAGESYGRRLRSLLLYLRYVFRELISLSLIHI